MTIRELLLDEDDGNREFTKAVNEYIHNFVNAVNNPARNAQECYNTYREAANQLAIACLHTFLIKLDPQQKNNINVANIIGKGKDLVDFTEETFVKGGLFVISLLIEKYSGKICISMVKLALIGLLFKYGMLYRIENKIDVTSNKPTFTSTTTWCDIVKNIDKLIETVLSNDVAALTHFSDNAIKNQLSAKVQNRTFVFDKPYKAEHLAMLWTEGMDRPTCVSVVAEYYNVDKKTARRWMKEWSLWESQELPDFKKKYEESLKIIEQLEKEVKQLKESIEKQEEIIKELKNNQKEQNRAFDINNKNTLSINKQFNMIF